MTAAQNGADLRKALQAAAEKDAKKTASTTDSKAADGGAAKGK